MHFKEIIYTIQINQTSRTIYALTLVAENRGLRLFIEKYIYRSLRNRHEAHRPGEALTLRTRETFTVSMELIAISLPPLCMSAIF